MDDRIEQDREEHVAGVVETEDATDDDGDGAVVEEVEERHLEQQSAASASASAGERLVHCWRRTMPVAVGMRAARALRPLRRELVL